MAITLNINLTNEEQAKASEIIDILLPGKTNQEKLNLLQTQAKRLLVEDLKKRVHNHRERVREEELITQKNSDESVLIQIYTDLDPAPQSIGTNPDLIPGEPIPPTA